MTSLYLWIILIAWIAIGLFVGTVSCYMPPGHDSGGWLTNAGFGVLGSLLGGAFATVTVGGTMLPPKGAVAGAIALVLLWRLLRREPS